MALHDALSHTPVAMHADTIFSTTLPGTVTLVEGPTGSGKSLFSPIELADQLEGDILVLVPSKDIAFDNARRVASIADWRIGREVGIYAGGKRVFGTQIVFATYGAFLVNRDLRGVVWKAILLDESHAESWQVEAARSDVHGRLEEGDGTVVMELSATMDPEKLKRYWGTGRIPVTHHNIPGHDTPFPVRFVECEHRRDLDGIVIEYVEMGHRFVMVTQPGIVECERLRRQLREKFAAFHSLVSVFVYHGETEEEEVARALAPLSPGEARVLVATPRLLTGWNREDLTCLITDGFEKMTFDGGGTTLLKPTPMSQWKLRQARGRLGRFPTDIEPVFVLVGEPFGARPLHDVPEVSRTSSLPLALGLCCMGRNPLEIRFCNEPIDIEGSMRSLLEWGFVDEDASPTPEGEQANALDIRPDRARFLLTLLADEEASTQARVLGIFTAAALEAGGVGRKWSPREDHVDPPRLCGWSDSVNEGLRFAHASTRVWEDLWKTGYHPKAVRRARACVYRILKVLNDRTLLDHFNGIFAEDENEGGTEADKKESPRNKAWSVLGAGIVHGKLPPEVCAALQRAIVVTARQQIWEVGEGRRGICGRPVMGNQSYCAVAIGHESACHPHAGQLLIATRQTIVPRNGRPPFPVLVNITTLTAPVVAAALGHVYLQEEGTPLYGAPTYNEKIIDAGGVELYRRDGVRALV